MMASGFDIANLVKVLHQFVSYFTSAHARLQASSTTKELLVSQCTADTDPQSSIFKLLY